MADVTVSRGYPATPNPPVGTILTTPPVSAGVPDEKAKQGLIERNLQFLTRPDVQAGLIGFGISAMQGVPPGQTDLGALGTSIGRGLNAAGQVQSSQQEQQQQAIQNKLAERKVGAVETQAGAAATTAATGQKALGQRAKEADRSYGLARDKFASDQEYRAAQLKLDAISAQADSARAQAAVESNDVRRAELEQQANQFDAQLEQAKSQFTQTLPLEQAKAGADVTRALAASTQADAAKTQAETQRSLGQQELDLKAKQFAEGLKAKGQIADVTAAANIYKALQETNIFNNIPQDQLPQLVTTVINAAKGTAAPAPAPAPAADAQAAEAEKQRRVAALRDPGNRQRLVDQFGEAAVQQLERDLGIR